VCASPFTAARPPRITDTVESCRDMLLDEPEWRSGHRSDSRPTESGSRQAGIANDRASTEVVRHQRPAPDARTCAPGETSRRRRRRRPSPARICALNRRLLSILPV
jgi:hypothetical protein